MPSESRSSSPCRNTSNSHQREDQESDLTGREFFSDNCFHLPRHPRDAAPLEYAKMLLSTISARIRLIAVELKMLPGEAAAATRFLQSKIQGQIRVNGNRIEIKDEKVLTVSFVFVSSCTVK